MRRRSIAACICVPWRASRKIDEILVVNDQSTDGTANVVKGLMGESSQPAPAWKPAGLPDGWVGKNHALWVGVQTGQMCLAPFHRCRRGTRAEFRLACTSSCAGNTTPLLVSFSPEQITETWYEKALIPYIYLRLAKRFSYEKVNDPNSPAAAAKRPVSDDAPRCVRRHRRPFQRRRRGPGRRRPRHGA